MSFFTKLFKRKGKEFTDSFLHAINFELTQKITKECYLSKSEYTKLISNYKVLYDEIKTMESSGMIDEYINKKKINKKDISEFSMFFDDESLRNAHNNIFCASEINRNRDYFDHILDSFDPNIKLDNDQLKVVVSDEDNTLVIAGAGAGKTTTVAAKVKYLVDIKKISPEDILVVSFTNKAVDELKDRINKKLGINCAISTFHSVGSSLISSNEDRKTIKEENFLFNSIRNYLKERILVDKTMANKILLFFASYLNVPPNLDMPLDEFFKYSSKTEFTTMRGDLKVRAENIANNRENKNITIKNEQVASYQELQIANFLFINGIDYIYEDNYKYQIKGSHKIYTPDFHLKQNGKEAYLEHFGMVDDKGHNNTRTKEEIETYIKAIKDKIALHKEHQTPLLMTFGGYSDGNDIIYHLKEQLVKYGFELNEKTQEEVLQTILSDESNKYINKFVFFLKDFISAFKTNGYNQSQFKIFKAKSKNERVKIFLDICEGAYNYYENDLKNNNSIDFSDMINNSVEVIKNMQENQEFLTYKYLIIDEYQDISHQRYNLARELSKICNAKIIAVGDDWQSIYAFSGSDITLFTEFKKSIRSPKLGCELLYINNTYRNSQELIDIAGRFVLKNQTQITKQLKSPKSIEDPVIIYSYCNDKKKIQENNLHNATYQKAFALQTILDRLVSENPEILTKKGKEPILLIGRFNFDLQRLSVGDFTNFGRTEEEKEDYNLFEYDQNKKTLVSKKYPDLRLAFLTAHSSKGLTYDNVIIINSMNDTYGFPSKIEDDPIMDLVIKKDMALDYAEERRLFYVALTRTSNRVFIISPETKPSEFVTELIKDEGYKNIVVKGVFNEQIRNDKTYYCPDCGFPLKKRQSNVLGMPLYICTNEHELCGFMTNDIRGGRMRVLKCPDCLDGYLIVKKKKEEEHRFLGCTNYSNNGAGCNVTISMANYNEMFPEGNIVKYSLKQVMNKTPLIIKGEDEDNYDTSKILSDLKEIKEKSTKKENNVKPSTKNEHTDDEVEMYKNHPLYQSLSKLRFKLAAEKDVKPFVILHNKTIVEIIKRMPKTIDELVEIPYIGKRKADEFGPLIIEVINSFR